jgi:hypothetical protein
MIDINWKPTRKDLRVFATACLVFAVGFGIAFWVNSGVLTTISKVLFIVGPALFVLGMAWPPSLKYVYIALSLIAFPIGLVLGNVLMALVYYLLVTPIGLVFRLLGKDPMHRKFDPKATTYWISRSKPPEPGRYFRQF